MSATIKDVARVAGVSVATVSKALNAKIHVRKETREKVAKIAVELGYYPSAFGRGLVLQRTGNIAFVLDRAPRYLFSNMFYSKVLDGIVNELIQQDYNLLISSHTFSDLNSDDGMPKFVLEKNVDGLILIGKLEMRLVHEIYRRGIPFVFVDNFVRDKHYDCVMTDNLHGGVQAVTYLVEMGHRKIGFLKGIGKHISVTERWESFKQTLKENNLPLEESWIGEGDVNLNGGREAMKQILSRSKTLPTAIFATNDEMSFGALQVLKEHGIDVPGQISLVGFDDVADASHQDPPITTVYVEKEEMGRIGTQLLIDRIKNPKAPAKRVTLPTRIVIRKSVRNLNPPPKA